jgi:hypothetical protein
LSDPCQKADKVLLGKQEKIAACFSLLLSGPLFAPSLEDLFVKIHCGTPIAYIRPE